MTSQLPPRTADPAARVRAAYAAIRAADRPEVWIHLRPEAELLADAEQLAARFPGGTRPALFGLLVAVKDNIDVAGLPTTAACPSFAYTPERDAAAVRRLREAGALILGKTNLDQFATGLVGTRSPYGAVRNAHDPALVSGGSSSGSAVAVALGFADAALGTDTAGSGRVPAAFNRIASIKPTAGYVPLDGVLPACASYDAVNVFAADLATAGEVLAVLGAGGTGTERTLPAAYPLAAPAAPTLAVVDPAGLPHLAPAWQHAYRDAVGHAAAQGWRTVTVDPAPLLAAGALLYSGALVAERHAAVGAFVDAGAEDLDPTVAGIISAAGRHSASALAADQRKVSGYRRQARELLALVDALLLPTAPFHPSIAEVQADPVGVNSRVGTYTTFLNVLDLAAVAFPAPGRPEFGLSLIGPAFTDLALLDLAERFTGAAGSAPDLYPCLDVAAFGAHMRGEPLNAQLEDLGARYGGDVITDGGSRLLVLPSDTPVSRVALVPAADGAPVAGERWQLSPHALGLLLALVGTPQSLGKVRLEDGELMTAFLADSTVTALDITAHGGWRAYAAAALTS